MSDSTITIFGNVASDVQSRETPSGLLTSFRLASQRRYQNRRTGRWVDDGPSFFRVVCWRGVAENVGRCLRKGEPVIVYGRVELKDWTDDEGGRHTDGEIDALTVGYDLKRGTAVFTRTKRQQAVATEGEEDPLDFIRHEQRANADADVIVDPSTGEMFSVGQLQSTRPGRPASSSDQSSGQPDPAAAPSTAASSTGKSAASDPAAASGAEPTAAARPVAGEQPRKSAAARTQEKAGVGG